MEYAHTLTDKECYQLIDLILVSKQVLIIFQQPAVEHETRHDKRCSSVLDYIPNLPEPTLIDIMSSRKVHFLLVTINYTITIDVVDQCHSTMRAIGIPFTYT